MKLAARGVLLTVLAIGPAAVALEDQTQPQQPVSVAGLRKAIGTAETLTAAVAAIDQEQQIVVLKSDTGIERTLYLGQDISKVKHLKVGDRITLKYYMSLGTHLVRPGETTRSGQVGAVAGAAGGRMVAEQVRWIVNVNAVDKEKGTVTVTTENGRTITFLAEDKSRIAELKPNDRIEVVLTAAALISVEPAPAK